MDVSLPKPPSRESDAAAIVDPARSWEVGFRSQGWKQPAMRRKVFQDAPAKIPHSVPARPTLHGARMTRAARPMMGFLCCRARTGSMQNISPREGIFANQLAVVSMFTELGQKVSFTPEKKKVILSQNLLSRCPFQSTLRVLLIGQEAANPPPARESPR